MARDYGYIISPSLTRYSFEPNKVVSDKFTVTNSFVTGEPESQTFILSVKFVFQDAGKKIIYDKIPNGRQAYDMTSWITLTKKEITLRQNESVEIPYTITVPAEPLPGGKYAAIVIEKKSALSQLTTSGASLDDKVAYQILGKIAGTELRDSEVTSFKIDKKVLWMWPNDEATLTLDFANKGNVDFLPSGDIFVHSRSITQAFWNAAFNPEQLVILPENSRQYSVILKPKTGLFRTDREGLTINLDYFRIGKYYATAKVGYDVNNNRVIADHVVSFWIIPLPLLGIVLGAIAAIVLTRFVSKKLGKKK